MDLKVKELESEESLGWTLVYYHPGSNSVDVVHYDSEEDLIEECENEGDCFHPEYHMVFRGKLDGLRIKPRLDIVAIEEESDGEKTSEDVEEELQIKTKMITF